MPGGVKEAEGRQGVEMTYFLFAIVVVLQAVAQILERFGMKQIGSVTFLNGAAILDIITNPFVVSGVLLSASGLLLWLAVLSRLNVSFIYPFGAVAYILVALMAFFFLNESITVMKWVGICVIIIGCVLLNW